MELKKYQKDAIFGNKSTRTKGLLPETLDLLEYDGEGIPIIVLKSITGSGKTIIAAHYIEEILNSKDRNSDKNLVIIWLSKGTANLHIQSCNKIKKFIKSKDINIYGIKDVIDFNADEFYDKDVYMINWEKLNNKDKQGNLSSNLFIDSENKNLTRAIKNTKRKNNTDFIFLIDEFHANYGSDSYNKIVNMFNPKIIIGMSATPKAEQMANADTKIIIKIKSVQEEEMVKKGILFNTTKDIPPISEYDTIEEYFLRLAIKQRNLLEEYYKKEGSSVLPLLLIQFDDDKKNTKIKNEEIIKVKEILDKIYDDNIRNDYAIWISDEDKELRSEKGIIDTLVDNNVKILLFKQAVAQGWDCPRAQILLKFRKVATKEDYSFDLQTLGRIFRMPEQKYYKNDELNYGYVYIPNDDYTLQKEFEESLEEEKTVFNIKEFFIKDEFKDDIKYIENKLKGQNNTINDELIDDETYAKYIDKLINGLTDIKDLSYIHELDKTKTYSSKALEINESLTDSKREITLTDGISFEITETDTMHALEVKSFFNELLKSSYSNNVKNHFKTQIIKYFKKISKEKDPEKIEIDKNNLILLNKDKIKELISKLDDYKKLTTIRSKGENIDFRFPISIHCSKDCIINNDKNIYGISLNTMSNPEKIFISKLEENKNVKCWYKNKDKGTDAFCIVYKTEESINGKTTTREYPTYPDFIVFFNDNSIGFYEIKDKDKLENINKDKKIYIEKRIKELNKLDIGKFYGTLLNVEQDKNLIENFNELDEFN